MLGAARVKEEPGCAVADQVIVKDEAKYRDGEAFIKEESEWLNDASLFGISEAAVQDGLYSDHQVKDELVLGPESVQRPNVIAVVHVIVKDEAKYRDGEAFIKEESEWLNDASLFGISEAAVQDGLYSDHQVKDELVLGPESVQRPNVIAVVHDGALGWSQELAQERARGPQFALRECSVRIERLPLSGAPRARARGSDHGKTKSLVRDCRVRLESCAAPCGATARGPAPASQPPRGHDSAPPHPRADILQHAANTYVCDMCERTFTRKHNLIRHIKAHMEKYEPLNKSKIIHKRNYATYGIYSCDCKKEFTILTDLLIHIRIRSGGKTYSCAICNKRFPRRDSFVIHTRIHTGQKRFSCEICERKFIRPQCLRKHKTTVHNVGQIIFSCDICNKSFENSVHLKVHKRVHTGEKPYSCEVCKKRFTQLTDLKAHRRIHTGERPYPCQKCKKRFRKLSDFYRHKRIHTGEKPHCCEICGMIFRRLYCLTEHIRIHTGEKPFCCEICSDLFASSWALRSHKQIHARRTQHETTKRGRPRKRPASPLANCVAKRGRPRTRVNCKRDDMNDGWRKDVNDVVNGDPPHRE